MRRLVLVLVAVVGAAGCGSSTTSSADRPSAVAAFFPIAATVRALGGPTLAVRDLTPPGVEPHDLEPTTDQVDAVLDADLAVVMGHGFQPAIERSAENREARAWWSWIGSPRHPIRTCGSTPSRWRE